MNPIAKGNVEIMVHTTAPSLGIDDTRYRNLALAYLDFRPAKRRKLEADHFGNGLDTQQIGSQQHQSVQEERDSDASWQPEEDGHESISEQPPLIDLEGFDITELLASPQLSFSSVEDNRASPAFRAPITWRHPDSQKSAEESWKRPGSEVPDSQPENRNPILAEFSSPTRILEVFLQNRDSLSSGPSTESQRDPDSLELLIRSQRMSRIEGSQFQTQDKDSLEVYLSIEECFSSSKSLLEHYNEVQGSPELEVDRTWPIISLQSSNSVKGFQEKPGPQVNANSTKPSSQILPNNQNGFENSTLQFGITKQHAQSSQVSISNSSPSPPKRSPRKPGRALRTKSPNAPLIQEQQATNKRKHLGSISETHPPSSAPPALAINAALPPHPPKRRRLEAASSPLKPITITTSPTTSNLLTSSSTKPPTTVWTSKLEIHPPPPKTSTAQLKPEMLITPKLHAMAQKMPLASYFHAKASESRDLRAMERGYWSIDCRGWSEEVRVGCWNFLGEVVGKGLAGWGVWCVRDGGGKEGKEGEGGDEAEWGSFRVYCWGSVVGHLWLLLKVASLNRVVKSGAVWIGGDGGIVVRISEGT